MSRSGFPSRFIPVALGSALLLFGFMPAASAQGTWTSLAPVPSATNVGVEGMQTGVIGNDIIAAFGFDPGAGDTVKTRIYDIASDTWTSGSDGPLPGRSEGAAVTHDGSLYAVGGRSSVVLANLDQYTPATDTWASLAPMPTARAGLGVARVGDAIYAIGGRTSPGGPCTGGELATVERFDIASGTWSTVAPLLSARSDLAATTKGGKIYVFGGCAGRVFLGNVDVYDPNTDTWSTAPADLPTPRAAMYAVGKKGGTIFVIGGYAGGIAALGVNEAYKVSKDSWSTWAPMLTPRAEMGVVSHGGRIYTVGGGLPAFGASTNQNEVFKPSPA